MSKKICVKTGSKINLSLEIIGRRGDGFHDIETIMQSVKFEDTLTFSINYISQKENRITLKGPNCSQIAYDRTNLIYRAIELFFKECNISNQSICVDIDKNIWISAGLGGGSSDASATLFVLSEIYEIFRDKKSLHTLCSKLGSDLNFCLEGGCIFASGRGEKIEKLNSYLDTKLCLIKPKNLGISAQYAYSRFQEQNLYNKHKIGNSKKIKDLLNSQKNFDEDLLYNSLQIAILNDFDELKYIKEKLPKALMSGSGSSFFVLQDRLSEKEKSFFPKDKFEVLENVKTSSKNIEII